MGKRDDWQFDFSQMNIADLATADYTATCPAAEAIQLYKVILARFTRRFPYQGDPRKVEAWDKLTLGQLSDALKRWRAAYDALPADVRARLG